jgi:hypothetical protein
MRLRRFQALQLVLLISAMVATRAAAHNSTITKQVRINLTEPVINIGNVRGINI